MFIFSSNSAKHAGAKTLVAVIKATARNCFFQRPMKASMKAPGKNMLWQPDSFFPWKT